MKLWKPLLAAALLLIAACSKEKEDDVLPVLRSIVPEIYSFEMEPCGSVEIPFMVEDSDFRFNYTVGGSSNQVKLILPGGKAPEEVSLKEVRAGAEKGSYVAVIVDNGFNRNYEVTASIAIIQKDSKTGNESFVRSAGILFHSRKDPDGTVYTGLPIVYVNTAGGQGIYSKTEFVPATMSIKGISGVEGLDEVSCSIRGRGNTTWTWPKKPYLIKLDKRHSVAGFPEHKRWVLLANFMDRTLMRNMVSMKVASMMDNLAWTPHCQSVELVLNGKHVGNYLLIEQVRVDVNRVNITEMGKGDNSGDAVTGGYLLELDFHYDNEFQWKDHGIPFAVKNPDPEDITQEQKTYIKNYIAEVANVIYGDDFADPEKGYAKYLDIESFIDYWIVFEVMCNHELGNPGSVYFHKDRGGKLVAGPCWDFDWGVLSFKTSNGQNGLVNGKAIWYARLFQDPIFKARVKARFNELLPKLETIPAYMDYCRDMLTESARLNFMMWNPAEDASQNGGQIINGDENLSFSAAVDRLKENYTWHLSVIKSKL